MTGGNIEMLSLYDLVTRSHYTAIGARKMEYPPIELKKPNADWRIFQGTSTQAPMTVETSLHLDNDMPLTQRRQLETIINLPGSTLEESCRCNEAINAVAAHCQFQEGMYSKR
jgi:hypothetical protein